MALISEGIDRMRVFALPAGIGTEGAAVHEPMHALVAWRSTHHGKLHQVYVNGRLAGVTHDCAQRRLVIPLPSSWTAPLRIEVFAVSPAESYIDLCGTLHAYPLQGRVQIGWLRRMGLPTGGVVHIYSNRGNGPVDYTSPVAGPIPIWPALHDKCGFGMSRFGLSDFGFDASAAAGFGLGLFGAGEFGFDADAMYWTSEELADGVYRFGAKITDAFGNESAPVETGEIVIVRAARPAGAIKAASFDKTKDQLQIQLAR